MMKGLGVVYTSFTLECYPVDYLHWPILQLNVYRLLYR